MIIPATRSGALWSMVNGGAAVVIPFAVFIIFARMMSPGQLSPILLAVAVLEVVKACGPQGVYDVVMRHAESDRRYYESAAALFLMFGVALTVVFCVLILVWPIFSPIVLPPILMLLGLKILFDYLVLQPQAVLSRRLAFKRLGSRGLIAGVVSGAGGLAIAALISPVLGLASYYVLQSLVILAMTAFGTGALMRPRLDLSATREMAAEGARASGVRLTAVGFNYLDQLVLGAMVVPGLLGLYNLGKRIEVVAITIASSFGQMMFQPIFATSDPEHRAIHMGRGIAAISLVCGVPFVVLSLFARLAVPFVFGPQWLPAAGVVALLGLGGLARALGGVAGSLLTVTGRNAVLLKIGFWAAGLSALLILGLARFGVEVVAAGILARNVLFSYIQFRSTDDARGRLLALFSFNCFLPLGAVALVSWVVGAGLGALIGVTSPVAVFAVLAAAGLSGAAVGVVLLFPRI